MAVRVSSPVMVGRSDELGRLVTAMAAARGGDPRTVLVSGEAGVGKTRLVAEATADAEVAGTEVLRGGCIVLGEGTLPFAPVVEALRVFVRQTDPARVEALVGAGRPELARLVPDLGPVTAAADPGLAIASDQSRLFEFVLGFLERLAATAPVLFVVEDLHWSDRSTRDLLGFLVRNLRDSPITLLLTYRSDDLHRRHPLLPFLAELERTGRVERLDLRPLTLGDAGTQLRAIAGHDLDAGLVASIHARSNGNPFFAEELLAAAGDDGRSTLPVTLRDVVLARIAGLAEPTQEFLRVASATGQRLDPAILAEAVAMDEATLYDALRESVQRQVLVADPTAGVERYAFRHALLQEAIYDDLLPGERTRLHSAFARALEHRGGDDPNQAAELAYHWYAAHDLPRALAASIVAGQAAESRHAYAEALGSYERAIELWDQVPDAEERAGRDQVDLLTTAASVGRFSDPARSVELARTALSLIDPAADTARAGFLNERLGRYCWIAGQGEAAQAAYREAVRLTPADPPSVGRARALAGLAQILMLGAHFAESRVIAEEALGIARAVGARDLEGHALNTRGQDRAAASGQVAEGLEDLRMARAIANDVGIVDDIGRAYANEVWVLELAGRLPDAIALAEEGTATMQRLGVMRMFGAHLLSNQADFEFLLGRWDDSERSSRRADSAAPMGINAILTQERLGRLAMVRGRFAEATERLEPLAAQAERATDVQFVEPVQASLAELAIWQGQQAHVVRQLAVAIPRIDFSPEARVGELYALGIRAAADVAELARARRTPHDVDAAVAEGEGWLTGMRRRHAEVLAERPVFTEASSAWLLLCEAEATRLDRRPDPDAWTASIGAWAALDRPYQESYALWRAAEARTAARGDRGTAAEEVRSAARIAEGLGAAPLLAEIRSFAARARLPLDDDTPAPDGGPASEDEASRIGLTPRERDVLALVALGRTNRQIAEELFISENTAGVHVSNILGKLGVNGRGEAAALAYRLGLVEVGEPSTDTD